ncbi:MAG: fumarylacetoacetate hydrolase family protein [Rhodospirillales bacterium]|nr:fumarylacetoacetate hydrolase family protein [Rhodospirillales bacterium]MDE0378819.1 fumarylacetoacetate hydrolase family protein [Rhodospirillales bacterium]
MTPDAIERAVALYAGGRYREQRIDALPRDCRPATLEDAYALQAALNVRLAATHGAVCGRKIGCTTPVMQHYLEIAHPCAGALYENRTFEAPATVGHADHWRPGVECEIAVRLGRSLPAADAPFDREAIVGAVAACMAAIEIVDDRYEDFRALDTPTLIADDFFSAGAVLGPAVTAWQGIDLAAAGGTMAINGAAVGAGTGADVMGHPFEALTWLANHAAASGRPLQAGDVVLTGSVVETKWVEPGDTVLVAIEGLGEAGVTFAR